MKSSTLRLSMPALLNMHPGNPHGLRFFEGDGGESGDGGAGDGEADQDASGGGEGGQGSGSRTINEHGYPDNTPVSEMTEGQRIAYEKHKREENRQRKQEWADATGGRTAQQVKADLEELAQLRREKMTPAEQQIDDVRRTAAETARAEERNLWAPRLVQAELRGALRARGIEGDKLDGIVGPLDHNYFLTDSGEVDADKVTNYVAGFGQAGETWPDMGQGRRGEHTDRPSVSRARDTYLEERRAKTTQR